MKNAIGVILAAGKGTRMKSTRPKVLHEVCGEPMIYYTVHCLKDAGIKEIYVVVGYHGEEVKSKLSEEKVKFIQQDKLLGTADALRTVIEKVNIKENNNIIVLYADSPLIKSDMIRRQYKYHNENKADCTIGSLKIETNATEFLDYGKVIRDADGNILEVLEKDELPPSRNNYEEVNLGIYCFKYSKRFRKMLSEIQPSAKKELYLTNIITLLRDNGFKVEGFEFEWSSNLIGVNTQTDIAKVNKIMRLNLIDKFLKQGVTIIDPDSTYLSNGVEIGKDTVIYPNAVIEKDVKIGKKCVIGPCCRLRSGTIVEDKVEIGNFVEVVRSYIKKGVKIKHFSYIGDATIEEGVNIGAGTITANFDGEKKSSTVIKKNAFIGSGTILIAPVTVGKGAITGAGCVIPKRKDVPEYTTVLGVPAKILKQNVKRK